MPATWDELIGELSAWAEVREVGDGLAVTLHASGERRTVHVVMDRSDWEELAWVIRRATPDTVREQILGLDEDQPYLVCDSATELVPSRSRELPTAPLNYKPAAGGRWSTRDGASEFGGQQSEER